MKKKLDISSHKRYDILLKEFHPTLNGELKLTDFAPFSNKKVWWTCDVADDHVWDAIIASRVSGRNCPCCDGKKIVLSNCLATKNPELAKEWHKTKNLPLTPFDVFSGGHKKYWWKCSVADDHEWDATIYERINGHGCSCCCGQKVVLSNCLATLYPNLAKEWHPTKNNGLTPFDFTISSDKKVWWTCDKVDDHEWVSTIDNRVKGNGCSCCYGRKAVLSNCLATINPDLSKEWNYTKNFPLTPFDVFSGGHKKYWWKCDKADDHEWEATISNRNRINGGGCSCCSGHKTVLSNCLATTHPNDAKQWHPTKNFPLTPFDVSGGHKKYWWKCDVADDHEWQATINKKTRSESGGCSCCTGQKVVLSNCLATTHPETSKQWHPTKNFPLTPFDVTFGSGKKVWWKCDNKHEWIATIYSMVKSVILGGNGCSLCYDSNGERKIKNILNGMNIDYEVEKRFDDCKHKQKLPFDFYLPKHNVLIEYDGEQHFNPIYLFGGVKAFNGTKKRDKIKNEYAAKNNIPLLRIPYTKFNFIEEEIKSFLNSKA
jgi:uncharacterized protein involved in tolerance to divalent cations